MRLYGRDYLRRGLYEGGITHGVTQVVGKGGLICGGGGYNLLLVNFQWKTIADPQGGLPIKSARESECWALPLTLNYKSSHF